MRRRCFFKFGDHLDAFVGAGLQAVDYLLAKLDRHVISMLGRRARAWSALAKQIGAAEFDLCREQFPIGASLGSGACSIWIARGSVLTGCTATVQRSLNDGLGGANGLDHFLPCA